MVEQRADLEHLKYSLTPCCARCSPTTDINGGVGSIIASTINPQGRAESSDVTFPQIGTFTASPQCYCFGENTILYLKAT